MLGDTVFRNPVEAFNDAIERGDLSAVQGAAMFAGGFMYMGTEYIGQSAEVPHMRAVDSFKNIESRKYIRFSYAPG